MTTSQPDVFLSEWQENFGRVAEAVRRLGRAVKPVLRGRQGSRGRTPFGSAFVIAHRGEYAAVTAAHVVEEGPEPRYLGIAESSSVRWPEQYVRVAAKALDAADPDVAYFLFDVKPDAEPGAADAFPLSTVLTDLRPEPGTAFLAVGHPVSKGKIRPDTGTLRAGLAYVTGKAVLRDEYEKLRLDARVHLAMHYSPQDVRLADGSAGIGPAPSGMSGGVLLLMAQDERGVVQLSPVGVITSYRAGPPGLLIASRMDAVLDLLAPRLPPEQRDFARAL